ncbi:MAG TPA: response regulator transcription factor [Dictyobacter sp.]|jgi:DNA-binding response OmpR family regulator|nr:response regulator transcription factor [Dictyobacter sp.]
MKILIIDSDRDLVEMLASWLKTLEYEVYRALVFERIEAEWIAHNPDLVILDTAISGGDVLPLCCALRGQHDALILVMTDGKDVHDEVRCLEAGADGYLRKPFFPSQLLAHIHALSRRIRSTLEDRSSLLVTVGPIRVDTLQNEVQVYSKTTRLTPTECKLLHLLAVNANEVCAPDQIVRHVWGFDREGDSCLIKAHIRHLRQKIEQDPGRPRYILTVPGVGYTLVRRDIDESEEESALALRVV